MLMSNCALCLPKCGRVSFLFSALRESFGMLDELTVAAAHKLSGTRNQSAASDWVPAALHSNPSTRIVDRRFLLSRAGARLKLRPAAISRSQRDTADKLPIHCVATRKRHSLKQTHTHNIEFPIHLPGLFLDAGAGEHSRHLENVLTPHRNGPRPGTKLTTCMHCESYGSLTKAGDGKQCDVGN